MSQFVEVDIPQGRLRGKRVTSSTNGVTYYSFQGVPYAKPPVGPLRFKPPEDPEPWKGTRDATVEGAVAPQFDFIAKKFDGEEDSLFLNVHTPQWPATSLKAVMVFIHGGGFTRGSGNVDFFGPDYLIAEDVILVSFNYRLGALGFLYLEGSDITGNNGLRDQVMALKWVKNNIANFGGDPDNVTIFGESAGGVSVHYLVLSPLADGLFHKAIAQSGTAMLMGSDTPRDVSSQRAVRLAKILGCTSEEPQLVADFLRTVPAEEILAHQECLTQEEKDHPHDQPYFPTEEVGPELFLPGPVLSLLSEGQFTKVPFIIGVTSAEGKIIMLGDFFPTDLSELNQHFDRLLPRHLLPQNDRKQSEEIAKVVKKFYFGEGDLCSETITPYIDMMSDLMFVYPMHRTAQSHITWSPHPTYVYLFDHHGETGLGTLVKTADNHPGVIHGGELPYFAPISLLRHKFTPGSVDAQVHAGCVQMWTQFAKTGVPSSDAINTTWTPAAKEQLCYLNINKGFNMDSDMFKERMDFLEEVYRKYLPLKPNAHL